jgi:hypothetical protein
MRGTHHKANEVTLLVNEVKRMTADELYDTHWITIHPDTKQIIDGVSGKTFNSLLDWANSVYEDEPAYGNEKIGKFCGYDDD